MPYSIKKQNLGQIRLPLDASFDLTYRCNNNCRHCWLRIAPDAKEKEQELSFSEIKNIVNQSRMLGVRKWALSGGEPMLRQDFADIFDYITSYAISYSINTNGTFITPAIARLMQRKGNKMVALYGADAKTHDHITRNPGSYDATMRGFAYLKEAGAGFTVQLVPMRDNYHQFAQMVALAESLSRHYRIGAPWLYLSSSADPAINAEIKRQRLSPCAVIDLDKPSLSFEEKMEKETGCGIVKEGDAHLFAACIANRRNFHVDPYGKMGFCGFIKDPGLLYDLKQGTVEEAWEKFVPSLVDKVHGSKENQSNCAVCDKRKNCRWCPVYAYLEHGDYSRKIDYLCEVAEENKRYKEQWKTMHRVYYKIAGITVQVDADLPIQKNTFHAKLDHFKVEGPGTDTIYLHHHFSLPDLKEKDLGVRVYSKAPWSIYKKDASWIYLGISVNKGENELHRVAVFNHDHSRGEIYHPDDKFFNKGGFMALTLFATDQILLARVLADRQGCFMHACGIILNGKGLLFVGHSEAGKSTTSLMLKKQGGEILCDDRIIIHKTGEGFSIHGTWSHGDVPDISPKSAPLHAIFFLEQSKENRLVVIDDKIEIVRRLLACLIKPLVCADWWEKELNLIENIVKHVPCYKMHFDKSGKIVKQISNV